MLYIICAFESEARALIDVYKLKKHQSQPYPFFSNEEVVLLISGMGQKNAEAAAKHLLSNQTPTHKDTFINLGICAAQEKYAIGELVEVKSVQDEHAFFELSTLGTGIACVSCFSASEALDKAVQTDIAEMEAIAIYQVLRHAFQAKKISFLKIVSDHFTPFIPKKQFVIALVQKNIIPIQNHISVLKGDTRER